MSSTVAYHRHLVETFVENTPSLSARLLRTEGLFSRALADAELNEFASRLSATDRLLLARMLEDERRSAFFDALKILHEACVLESLKLTRNGEEIPPEPYGYTLFEEYLTLLDLGDWSSLGG